MADKDGLRVVKDSNGAVEMSTEDTNDSESSRNTNAVQVKYCSDTSDKIQMEQEAPTIPKRR